MKVIIQKSSSFSLKSRLMNSGSACFSSSKGVWVISEKNILQTDFEAEKNFARTYLAKKKIPHMILNSLIIHEENTNYTLMFNECLEIR